MKKYLKLSFLTFALVYGMNCSYGQDGNINAKDIAIKKTESLKTIMNLDNQQQKHLIYLFQTNEMLKNKLASQNTDGVIYLKGLRDIEKKEELRIKDILNDEQIKLFLENKEKLQSGN